jgi:hypothetical protein
MTSPATAGWSFANMQTTFRAVTGTPSEDQLSSAQIQALLNNYYVYSMPFELKEQITDQFLTFLTTPGVDVYSFPGGFFTDAPGAYADGFPLVFYQDPDIFFQDWPQQYAVNNIATGDSVTTNFSGGLQNPPIIIGTLFIVSDDPTGKQLVLTDTGLGTLTGDGTGTINYLTGAYSATFLTAPAASAVIYAKYQGYVGNRPQGVLFFNNQFTFRSVPDQAYQILMQGYIKPTLLVNANDTPLQPEWGPVIVYGAALERFAYTGDNDNYERYFPIFKRFENVALGRTIQQLTEQQSVPRF